MLWVVTVQTLILTCPFNLATVKSFTRYHMKGKFMASKYNLHVLFYTVRYLKLKNSDQITIFYVRVY